MKKVILCIDGSQESIPAVIKEEKNSQIVLIQLDVWLKDFPVTEHVSLKGYADYLSYEDCMSIEKDALGFVENWYRPKGEDLTLNEGYSLGELVRMPMCDFFIRIFKNILFIQRVVEKEFADEIVIFDDKSVISKIFLSFVSDRGGKFKKVEISPKPYTTHWFEASGVHKPPARLSGAVTSVLRDAIWAVINRCLSIAACRYRRTDSLNRTEIRLYFDTYKGYYSLVERLFGGSNWQVFLPQPPLKDLRQVNFLRNVFKNRVTFFNLKYNKEKPAKYFSSRCWQKFIDSISPDEYFIWRGVKFWNVISEELQNTYFELFPGILLEISYVEYIINKYKINFFLMPWDDATYNKSFTSVAKKMNLVTMRYQPGVFTNHPYMPLPRSDKLIVWGESGKNFYLKRNIPSDRIVITGNPITDVLARKKAGADRRAFCKKFRLDPGRKIVFYADTTYASDLTALDNYGDPIRILLKLIAAANKLTNIQFLVKFHHGDIEEKEKTELIKRLNTASNIAAFRSNFDIYAIMVNSDAVITEFSTAGVEAMLLDKPVVIFKLRNGGMDHVSPYEDGKGVIVVNRECDIIPAIERVFTDNELIKKLDMGRKEFLKHEIGIFQRV